MNINSTTEKDLFIEYLIKMDIEKIDLILDDHVVCFGATKTTFLNKLEYIFNQYRLSGAKENMLVVNNHKVSNRYQFILTVFDESMEINIAEHNGRIVSLFNNLDAQNRNHVDELSPFDLCFGKDEHIGFQPSPDYLILYSQCSIALNEFNTTEVKVYTSNEIRSWLDKYKSQYFEVEEQFYFFKFYEFKSLYEILQFLIKNLDNHPKVKKALRAYHDKGNYSPIDWYRIYEPLNYQGVVSFDQFFNKIDFEKKILQLKISLATYYFSGDDFFDIFEFNQIFSKNPNP